MVAENKSKIIAAFDFDGTITYGDTAIYFLLFTSGYIKTLFLLIKKLPILLAFVFGKATRQESKESIFQAFFQGKSFHEMKNLGKTFAETKLLRHIKPEAMKRIRWHLNQGHRCVLVSASIDVYLEPWAKSVGFSDVLASKLAVDAFGNVSGKLDGLNCRKEEKVRRLKELLGPLGNYQIYAYGDSDGDKELLEVAEYSFYRSMPA